jgi:hypothetical protein
MVVYKLLRAASNVLAFSASRRAATASGVSLGGWTGAGAGRTAAGFFAGFFLVATTSTVGKVTDVCAALVPLRQWNDARARTAQKDHAADTAGHANPRSKGLAVTPHGKFAGFGLGCNIITL